MSSQAIEPLIKNTDLEDARFIALEQLTAICIRDMNGEPVGRLADLIIDVGENRIAYVRIRLAGADGHDGGRVTIPWSALSVTPDADPALCVAVRGSTLRRLADQARNAGTP